VGEAARAIERAASLPRTEIEHAYALGLRGRLAFAAGDLAAAERHYTEALARQDRLRDQARCTSAMHFMDAFRADEHLGLLDARLAAGRVDDAHRLLGRLKGWAQARAERRAARHAQPSIADGRARLAGTPVGPIRAHRTLPPAVAVVDYLTRADALLVFVLRADGVAYARVAIEAAELQARVNEALRAISAGESDWRSPTARLAEVLLPPAVRRRISGAEHVVVVPHGPLHRVPFAALPIEGALFVERTTLSRATSSGGVLARLARSTPARPASALVVGDPRGDLPGARAEADEVASLYRGTVRKMVGGRARLGSVVEGLGGTDGVVHIAAHGHQGAAGQDGWLDLADGARLEAARIARTRTRAHLVVLSACESGLGAPNAGDEMPDALDRAFLRAGAGSVVSARWRVDDATTRILMRRFHEGLRDGGVAAALARAQRALLSGGAKGLDGALASRAGEAPCARGLATRCSRAPTSHPVHWAALEVTGDFR
jgi:CHAT domain-containing protein